MLNPDLSVEPRNSILICMECYTLRLTLSQSADITVNISLSSFSLASHVDPDSMPTEYTQRVLWLRLYHQHSSLTMTYLVQRPVPFK